MGYVLIYREAIVEKEEAKNSEEKAPKHIKKEKNKEQIKERKRERRQKEKEAKEKGIPSGRDGALDYLHTWKDNREHWHFKKNRQVQLQ